MPIDVSVIVPTHNRRGLLERLLQSLFRQTLSPDRFEIVVASDGSTDGTAEMVKALQKTHENLMFMEQQNQGPATARNAASRAARGKYLAFTDDDCIAADDWLEKLVKVFERSNAVAIQGRTSTVRSERTPLTIEVENERGMHGVPTCNAAYRKDVFHTAGGFDESFPFPHNEDADLAWRAEELGPIVFAPEVHVIHPPRRETLLRRARWVRYLQSDFLLFARHPEAYRRRCTASPWLTIYRQAFVFAQLGDLKSSVKYLIRPFKPRCFFEGIGLVLVRGWNLIRFFPDYCRASRRYRSVAPFRRSNKKDVAKRGVMQASGNPTLPEVRRTTDGGRDAKDEPALSGSKGAASIPAGLTRNGDSNCRVSILIATYNRAEVLRATLTAMCAVKRDGISVEWIVIDNNSNDHTAEVVRSFDRHLPLRYLFEPRPGKNCALNKAITECPLGELVVFTDDDIRPDPDWLGAIVAASSRWADHAVFGGRILPEWPAGGPPAWANTRVLQVAAFGLHDAGASEIPYPQRRLPCGGNLWIRREIFEKGFRYPEDVGPRPTRRKMGSEDALLIALRRSGFEPMYIPSAEVYHRIDPRMCTLAGFRRRSLTYGRGTLHYLGPPNQRTLRISYPLWLARQVALLAYGTAGWLLAWVAFPPHLRAKLFMTSLKHIGVAVESLDWAIQGRVRPAPAEPATVREQQNAVR